MSSTSHTTADRALHTRISLASIDDLQAWSAILSQFLKSREQAELVKELIIDLPLWNTWYGYDISKRKGDATEYDPSREPREEDHDLLRVIKPVGMHDEINKLVQKEAFLTSCTSRSEYAQASAILALLLCPNVQTLKISNIHHHLASFFKQANYQHLAQPVLQNLEHVELMTNGYSILSDEEYFQGMDILEDVRYFHRLPAIKSISADGISDQDADDWPLPPQTSGLKSIRITNSDISSLTLCSLTRMAKALEELTVSLGGRRTNDATESSIYIKSIGKALLCQKTSLKILDLDIDAYHNIHTLGSELEQEDDYHYDKDDPDAEEYERGRNGFDVTDSEDSIWTRDLPDTRPYGFTIGSFHDFEALTHLSIGIMTVLGAANSENEAPFRLIDALPPNLESLTLRGNQAGSSQYYDKHVQELIEGKAERLPRLKEILGVEAEIPSAQLLEPEGGE